MGVTQLADVEPISKNVGEFFNHYWPLTVKVRSEKERQALLLEMEQRCNMVVEQCPGEALRMVETCETLKRKCLNYEW